MRSDVAAPAGDAFGSLPAFLSVDVRSAPPLETGLRPCRNENQKDEGFWVTVEKPPIGVEHLDTFSRRALYRPSRGWSDVVSPPADGDGHWSFVFVP